MLNTRALALAEAQDGLITRAQATGAGMSESAIEYAIRPHGPWQRTVPGVYATFSGPLTELHRLRIAVLHVRGRGLVTGPAACVLHGLRYGPLGDTLASDAIDVLVENTRRRASPAFIRVHRTGRFPRPVWWVEDDVARGWRDREMTDDDMQWAPRSGIIPLAPVARAVVDTVIRLEVQPAGWQPACPEPAGCPQCWRGDPHAVRALRNVRALMCEAVQRSKTSIAHLTAEITAASRRGSGLARRVLVDLEAGCHSAPECELRDLVRTSRILPEPRWNKMLPGARGIYPDACWSEARLVVEVDSRAFHGFGDAPERTERRRARYAELGWRVLPVSPARLRNDPQAVLAEIEAAYLARMP